MTKKKEPSPSKMLIRLTEKGSKYSKEAQESHTHPGHFCEVSGLRWRARPGGKGVSKRWAQESVGISTEGAGIDSVARAKAASEALEKFTDKSILNWLYFSSVSLHVPNPLNAISVSLR